MDSAFEITLSPPKREGKESPLNKFTLKQLKIEQTKPMS